MFKVENKTLVKFTDTELDAVRFQNWLDLQSVRKQLLQTQVGNKKWTDHNAPDLFAREGMLEHCADAVNFVDDLKNFTEVVSKVINAGNYIYNFPLFQIDKSLTNKGVNQDITICLMFSGSLQEYPKYLRYPKENKKFVIDTFQVCAYGESNVPLLMPDFNFCMSGVYKGWLGDESLSLGENLTDFLEIQKEVYRIICLMLKNKVFGHLNEETQEWIYFTHQTPELKLELNRLGS